MKIILDKVKENDSELLFRLLEYSLFEESFYDGNEMNQEGIFDYPDFSLYYTSQDKEAFFIKDNQTKNLLGFIMIDNVTNKHQIKEFMILPNYRRKHIGKEAAFLSFNRYHGDWEVSPSMGSNTAHHFWKNVIQEYTNHNYQYQNGIFNFNK